MRRTQNFCKITTLDLSYVVTVKSTVEIQNFAAFSEYMNFTCCSMKMISCIDNSNLFFRAHDSLEINSLSRPLHVILLTIPHWIKILLLQDEPIALNYARIASYFALMSLPLQWVCIISIIILTN